MKQYLSASSIARMLNVDPATISRWAKKGVFGQAHRPIGKRNWRISLAAYQQWLRELKAKGKAEKYLERP